jgi:PEP-CTERM motif
MIRQMAKVLLAGMGLVVGTATAATIILDTTLTSPPGVYFGNGNANSGFTVSTDGTTELGLSVILRYVGPIDPGTSNVYTVPTGPPPGHTGSAWGFVFSVNTRYNGGTAVLGDFLYTLNVTDLTTGNVGPILDPVRSIGDDTGFGAGGKTAGVTPSTQWGAQNSEAPSFPVFLPGFDPNARDLYEIKITLTQLSSDGLTTLGSVSVFADAAVPEPGTFGLIGFGLVMVALAAHKRAHRG